MPGPYQINIGSDQPLAFLGVKDGISGAFLDDLTVSIQIQSQTGAIVATLSLEHFAGTLTDATTGIRYLDGNYLGVLPASTPLIEGEYNGLLTALSPTGVQTQQAVTLVAGFGGDGTSPITIEKGEADAQKLLRLTKKDAYLAADGRALVFNRPSNLVWPNDLTGWAITFSATKTPQNINAGANLSVAGTVTVPTGTWQQVQIELTSAQTATLAIGVGTLGYYWDVVATKSSDRATLRQGVMTVTQNVTT